MILGIIPARLKSTRLPEKPLADICGKPMIQWTYESARKSKLLDEVIIAVDNENLYNIIKEFGGNVILTPDDIQTGSDRIAHVAKKYKSADIIVNIQGDEPFIPGEMIDEAIEPLLFDKSIEVSTLAKRINSLADLNSPDIPKVVFDYNNDALYFSRSPIPYCRDEKNVEKKLKNYQFYKHIGLYTYRKNALLHFTSLQQTDLENTEKLEQLRMLENGIKIRVVVTERESISVDTKEDLADAIKYCKTNILKG